MAREGVTIGPGTILGGDFRIVRQLGAGGMGVVHVAEQLSTGSLRAVKVLREEVAADAEYVARFVNEAKLAARIRSDHVVHVIGAGRDPATGTAWLAMELLEGESLGACIRRSGRLAASEVREIFAQLCHALAAAHGAGIVHRDIKPENVFLTLPRRAGPHFTLKLLDLGIAKSTAEATRSATLPLGTPRWMAPEQTDYSAAITPAADVWALGLLAFWLLTGKTYWRSANAPEATTESFLREMLIEPMAPASERARALGCEASLPDAFDSWFARCIDREPAARFRDAAEAGGALDPILASAPGGGAVVELASADFTVAAPVRSSSVRGGATPGSPPAAAEGPIPGDEPASRAEFSATAFLDDRPRARPRSSRTALKIVAGVAVVALAVVGVASKYRKAPPVGASPSPSVASSSAPVATATRIIDLPPPRTSVPAAAGEYALGIRSIHDDNWGKAGAHFAKAVELDPSMAAAHLRRSMVMVSGLDPVMRRSEFEKAAGLREQLGERDQALMEALQPLLQGQTQDAVETDKRLRALALRYPTDAEIWMWIGLAHYGVPEGLAPAERALELDPGDGQSWENKGAALFIQGKAEEARAAFERCGAISIDSADCFQWMGRADVLAGRCADFERDAHKAADRNPRYLADVLWAMASNGASAEALEETVAQVVPAIPPTLGPELHRLGFGVRLAILAGDFPRASALAGQESATLAADPGLRSTYRAHYQLTMQLLDIALETGDEPAAQRLASDFLARSLAWQSGATVGHSVDLSLYLERLTLPVSEPAPREFEAKRRAWIDKRLAAGAYRGEVWSYAYASPAFTASEARAALDALAELGPPTPAGASMGGGYFGRRGSPEADAGRVYLLAGRVDEAIDHLKRAVAECDVFISTLDHVRAAQNLGRALEQKGDHQGACEAYGAVLTQWGHAKPRSVTADAARARVKALGCGAR